MNDLNMLLTCSGMTMSGRNARFYLSRRGQDGGVFSSREVATIIDLWVVIVQGVPSARGLGLR